MTAPTAVPSPTGQTPAVTFRDAFRFWLKLGFINFGGPTGQIAIMHEELVEKRRWISEEHFLHALNYCMFLPGPEAMQLAIYVGWLLHGTAGGLAAGIFFVLPAFFLLWGLSWLYAAHGQVAWVFSTFYGLRAVVVAIVAAAVIRIGKRALKSRLHRVLAAAAFVAIFVFQAPFPLIIAGAGLVGLLGLRPTAASVPAPPAAADGSRRPPVAGSAVMRSGVTLLLGLVIWAAPLAGIAAWRGRGDVLTREAWFFSKAAMVTFGGAYSVLAYINQAAVHEYGWLLPGQMIDGLGLAETTPGPLIIVTEFVGYLGAWRNPGGLAPALAGALGAAVTAWATFVPSFLFIFLGAPLIERLRGSARLNGALSAITAAVVGVVLNLAVGFGLNALFRRVDSVDLAGLILPVPRFASIDALGLAVALVAFVGLWRWKWGMGYVVAGGLAIGLGRFLLA